MLEPRRVAHLVFAAAAWWLTVLCAPRALAQQPRRIVLLEPRARSMPEGLVEALRIQLTGTATVNEVALESPSVDRVDAEREHDATTTVVWLDEGGARPTLTILLAGADSALALGSVPSGNDPELARILALKVGLLLERPAPPPDANRVRTRAFGELRALESAGGVPQLWLPSIGVAAGPRWNHARSLLEAYGSFALGSELRLQSPSGETDLDFAYLGAGARWISRSHRLGFGPFIELGLETLRARGSSRDKRTGTAELIAPKTTAGLQARWFVGQGLELCLNGGAEWWLTRERFEVLGTPTVDLGRARLSLGISGIFAFH